MERDPSAPRAVDRRGDIVAAAARGDVARVRDGLADVDPTVRAGALRAMAAAGLADATVTAGAASDPSPVVRRTLCELATSVDDAPYRDLLDDPDASVVEAAAFACGEVGDHAAVERLAAIATSHDDPLCRESAVAALGALGDPEGKAAVLAALGDINYIRRRAVVALATFEGPDVDAALKGRLEDRDWQVRQAAEDVIGVNRPNGD